MNWQRNGKDASHERVNSVLDTSDSCEEYEKAQRVVSSGEVNGMVGCAALSESDCIAASLSTILSSMSMYCAMLEFMSSVPRVFNERLASCRAMCCGEGVELLRCVLCGEDVSGECVSLGVMSSS